MLSSSYLLRRGGVPLIPRAETQVSCFHINRLQLWFSKTLPRCSVFIILLLILSTRLTAKSLFGVNQTCMVQGEPRVPRRILGVTGYSLREQFLIQLYRENNCIQGIHMLLESLVLSPAQTQMSKNTTAANNESHSFPVILILIFFPLRFVMWSSGTKLGNLQRKWIWGEHEKKSTF